MRILSLLILFASCTIVRLNPPIKRDLVFFDDTSSKDQYYINKKITVKYRSCVKGKPDKSYFSKPLQTKFEDKYKEALIGISEAEIKVLEVKDSSIFVRNETCVHLTGSPITKSKIDEKVEGEFALDDERMHVH